MKMVSEYVVSYCSIMWFISGMMLGHSTAKWARARTSSRIIAIVLIILSSIHTILMTR